MPNTRRVITIDGLAGSGKSSLSRELARKLGYAHLNSGLLYRAVAYTAHQAGEDKNPDQLCEFIKKHTFSLDISREGDSAVVFNGIFLGFELGSNEVGEMASKIARHKALRGLLLPIQRDAFPKNSVVAEGRDMGTVVFPDADLKFFITADQLVRAKRRARQLNLNDNDPDILEKVRIDIASRDERDQTRPESPTVAAADSVEIDNSSGSLTDAVNAMYNAMSSRGVIP